MGSRREEQSIGRRLLARSVRLERLAGGIQCFQRHARASILVQTALDRVVSSVLACFLASSDRCDRSLLDAAVDRPSHECTPEKYTCAKECKNGSNNNEDRTLWKSGVLHVGRIGSVGYNHGRNTSTCDCRIVVAERWHSGSFGGHGCTGGRGRTSRSARSGALGGGGRVRGRRIGGRCCCPAGGRFCSRGGCLFGLVAEVWHILGVCDRRSRKGEQRQQLCLFRNAYHVCCTAACLSDERLRRG